MFYSKMSVTENTIYTAVRPLRILTKIFGFSSQANLGAKEVNKFNLVGSIHVILIILLKLFLIYYNLSPSKFGQATNSRILNIGLWMQTEASLAISIFYILVGMRKNSDLCKLLQRFNEIDQEFTMSFFLKFHYVEAKHWISLYVVSGVTVYFLLVSITTYYIWNVPFEFWHKLSILVVIYLSNISIYSIANQYLCAQLYLASRFRNLNDILSQLVFDEPIGDRVLLDGTFHKPLTVHTKGKRIVEYAFQGTAKPRIAFVDSDNKDIRINYPFAREFPHKLSRRTSEQNKKVKSTTFWITAYKTCITKLAFTKSSTVGDVMNKLDKIMDLHDRLCDCVDLCNYLLAIQVLLISLTICVYIVFGLFAKYSESRQSCERFIEVGYEPLQKNVESPHRTLSYYAFID